MVQCFETLSSKSKPSCEAAISRTRPLVSQGIVLRVLNELGWPVFNSHSVAPEYALEGRRVDFALCDGRDHPKVFLEVKRVGQAEGGDRQLFEYAFYRGVPVAILTDGQEWSFYLPGEEGTSMSVVYTSLISWSATLRNATIGGHDILAIRVCWGQASCRGRTDYRERRQRDECRLPPTLPRAWAALLESQDSQLVDLLADKVEDICGYKPNPDTCSQFLSGLPAAGGAPAPARVRSAPSPPSSASGPGPYRGGVNLAQVGFSFQGSFYPLASQRM